MDLPPPSSFPARLAPGTLVGPWRVGALAGRGGHGEVYRAVRAGQEQALPVALKLALRPWDSRFSREAKLLSLFNHPSVPGLVDQGVWRPKGGAPHPFLVMEWVDGEPLYEWAQRKPSGQQVLRLLGQLADVLAALHAKGGVHRDVKGDNILVRRENGRAVLMDFGSGMPPRAASLTPPGAFVGTPAYRSTESWLFEQRSLRQPAARYGPQPADDVFALGVTACRLLTGEYPEPGATTQDASGTWSLDALMIPAGLQQVEEPVRGWVLSMLAVRAEQRPSAAQLAQALEQPGGAQQVASAAAAPSRQRVRTRRGRPKASALAGPALIAASLMLTARGVWTLSQSPALKLAVARNQAAQEAGDTAGLGGNAASLSEQEPVALPTRQAMEKEPLPEPQPGQLRPDGRGRCPGAKLVLLNGVCWAQTQLDSDLCERPNGQMYKGMCYQPIMPPGHPPTSSPKKSKDGAH